MRWLMKQDGEQVLEWPIRFFFCIHSDFLRLKISGNEMYDLIKNPKVAKFIKLLIL